MSDFILREDTDYIIFNTENEAIGVLRAGLLIENRLKVLLSEHFCEAIIEVKVNNYNYIAIDSDNNEISFYVL